MADLMPLHCLSSKWQIFLRSYISCLSKDNLKVNPASLSEWKSIRRVYKLRNWTAIRILLENNKIDISNSFADIPAAALYIKV